MSTGQLREQIRAALNGAGLSKVSDDILSKCTAMASNLNVSPTQVAECWEAYSLNKNVSSLDDHSFAAYRLQLIKEADVEMEDTTGSGAVITKKRDNSSVLITPAQNGKRQNQGSINDNSNNNNANNNSQNRVSLSPRKNAATMAAISNLPAYSERKNAGTVVTTYNPKELAASENDDEANSSTTAPKCVISTDFDTNVATPYRHMFTVLEERAAALEAALLEKHDEFATMYNFGSEQIAALEAVGVPRQDKICCIGRICNAAHEGKINATSVLLEGSRQMSGGQRVELDLSSLKEQKQSYSLFPGQIVAVEGMNSTGRKFVAERICEGVPPAPVESEVKDLLKFHHADEFQGGSALQIVTASGPFTTSDSLDYEPLLDLVSLVSQKKPDVVILTGPFVDMRQQAVASGQVTLESEGEDGTKEDVLVSYEAFFANKIAGLLEELYSSDDSIHTQFVLVPSLDDATAAWVYPQPPFTDRLPGGGQQLKIPGAEDIEIGTLGLQYVEQVGRDNKTPRRVHCASNPCTLKINEIVIGVTATDVLFDMSADETNANLEVGSRLARISQHMLQQRSYYPLFPGSAKTSLNLKFMDQWKMPCALDLFILPSKLTPFARAVLDNSTVVVNPGHLTRNTTGGTYAVVDIHPIARDALENAGGDDVKLKHNVQDRTRVEIKRI